jgi:dimethylargininase
VEIRAPGTIDGGDVLISEKTIFIGLSRRTNDDGIRQLREAVSPHGYRVVPVSVTGCLHLKSAVTLAAPEILLGNRAWLDPDPFRGMEWINVDGEEPAAGNVLRVGEALVFPANFPRTRGQVERRGFRTFALDISEIQKAEGAVTCCSLLFEA